MYTVSVKTQFTASHQLTAADGSKELLHRHSWAVTAEVSSTSLNDLGLVMDFNRLKEMVDNVVADFCRKASCGDNSCLEDLDYFQKNNSSAENVAKYIYERLASAVRHPAEKLPTNLNLDSITVVEQPNCSAKFTGSPGDCQGPL